MYALLSFHGLLFLRKHIHNKKLLIHHQQMDTQFYTSPTWQTNAFIEVLYESMGGVLGKYR